MPFNSSTIDKVVNIHAEAPGIDVVFEANISQGRDCTALITTIRLLYTDTVILNFEA